LVHTAQPGSLVLLDKALGGIVVDRTSELCPALALERRVEAAGASTQAHEELHIV
jgi:hypothetical protein